MMRSVYMFAAAVITVALFGALILLVSQFMVGLRALHAVHALWAPWVPGLFVAINSTVTTLLCLWIVMRKRQPEDEPVLRR